jgi:hypothetical protein
VLAVVMYSGFLSAGPSSVLTGIVGILAILVAADCHVREDKAADPTLIPCLQRDPTATIRDLPALSGVPRPRFQ